MTNTLKEDVEKRIVDMNYKLHSYPLKCVECIEHTKCFVMNTAPIKL